jgi:hypothetical protein
LGAGARPIHAIRVILQRSVLPDCSPFVICFRAARRPQDRESYSSGGDFGARPNLGQHRQAELLAKFDPLTVSCWSNLSKRLMHCNNQAHMSDEIVLLPMLFGDKANLPKRNLRG